MLETSQGTLPVFSEHEMRVIRFTAGYSIFVVTMGRDLRPQNSDPQVEDWQPLIDYLRKTEDQFNYDSTRMYNESDLRLFANTIRYFIQHSNEAVVRLLREHCQTDPYYTNVELEMLRDKVDTYRELLGFCESLDSLQHIDHDRTHLMKREIADLFAASFPLG